MKISKRLQVVKPSPTLELTAKVAAMRAEGVNVIGFGAGEPDFDTPERIKESGIEAIRSGHTKYTAVDGIPQLKDALIEKYQKEAGLKYSRDEIIVSAGAKHSIYNIAMALWEEGDEVIIPAPYWVSYPEIVALTGAKPVIVNTSEKHGFTLTEAKLLKAITPKTKAIILNYPGNPTGATYNSDQLLAIGQIALENDLTIVSDEIYDKIVYSEAPHTSIASLNDDIKKITLVVNGVSKTYSMTGWRIGYVLGNSDVVKAMKTIQGQSTSNPATMSQYAALEAITGPQDDVEEMRAEYKVRRDFIVNRLNSIPGVSCIEPAGSFYVFPNVSYYFNQNPENYAVTNSLQFADFLLSEAKVGVVPGIAFGDDSCIRMSFAISRNDIEEGLNRMESALRNLIV